MNYVTMPEWQVYFLFGLVVFLWGTGGIGWKGNFEKTTNTNLSGFGAVIVYLLWPLFSIIAGLQHTYMVLTGRDEEGA